MPDPLRLPRIEAGRYRARLGERYAVDGATAYKGQHVARIDDDDDRPVEAAAPGLRPLAALARSTGGDAPLAKIEPAANTTDSPAPPHLRVVARDGDTEPAYVPLTLPAPPIQIPHILRIAAGITAVDGMRSVLIEEWRASGVDLGIEDFVLRAVARAFRADDVLRLLGETLLLVAPGSGAGPIWVANAASRLFREAAVARMTGGDPGADDRPAACVVTTYAHAGISEASPEVDGVRPVAVTVGAPEDTVALEYNQPVARRRLPIAFAVDRSRIDDGRAVRLAAHVRALLEEPYELLGD